MCGPLVWVWRRLAVVCWQYCCHLFLWQDRWNSPDSEAPSSSGYTRIPPGVHQSAVGCSAVCSPLATGGGWVVQCRHISTLTSLGLTCLAVCPPCPALPRLTKYSTEDTGHCCVEQYSTEDTDHCCVQQDRAKYGEHNGTLQDTTQHKSTYDIAICCWIQNYTKHSSLEKSGGIRAGFRSLLNPENILMDLSGVSVKLQIAYIGFRQAKPFYPTNQSFSNYPSGSYPKKNLL